MKNVPWTVAGLDAAAVEHLDAGAVERLVARSNGAAPVDWVWLAAILSTLWGDAPPRCVGLCGGQGAGKSTLARLLVEALEQRGVRAVTVSIDDFYLTKEERRALAKSVHPLLATRGPPGTHDVDLAVATIRQLRAGGRHTVRLPVFDKGRDDRGVARPVTAPFDVVVLEGWCVGARAQDAAELAEPVNDLERIRPKGFSVPMLYHAYELSHALLHPWHQAAAMGEAFFDNPHSPLSYVPGLQPIGASCRVYKSLTKRYGKPEFGIADTMIEGLPTPIEQETLLRKPFCDLIHFNRDEAVCGKRNDPKVLIVAPMSGHFPTLLRGTVKAMVSEHNTYVTDWRDAREVPLLLGGFDLDDYIQYVIDFIRHLGPDTHVMAVCQPAVPVLAAAAVMAAMDDPCTPASLTLMGGPIDPRCNPTAVNEHADAHGLDWFRRHVLSYVPYPNVGAMQRVYPGFLQLSGFMSMNMERHVNAYSDYFLHLVTGDADSAEQHKRFYDEYLSVMDLPAEFFLDTVDQVFHKHALAKGTFKFKGQGVDCSALRNTALMTVEGELDDICAVGQTEAAHNLCGNVATDDRYHYVQPGVGHYGVFNGTRWRTEIQPRIREMIRTTAFKRRAQPH